MNTTKRFNIVAGLTLLVFTAYLVNIMSAQETFIYVAGPIMAILLLFILLAGYNLMERPSNKEIFSTQEETK